MSKTGFPWNSLARLLTKAHTWTGQQTFSNINVTGGSITGAITTLPMATSTNPGVSVATTTTIVDANSGVIILQNDGSPAAQTIGSPTVATAGKLFTVINNDTSVEAVVVNGFTVTPGEAQSFIWDGSAWGPTDLGITAIPVAITQGGTGQVTASAAMNALGIPSATAENNFIVAGSSPFAWAIKTLVQTKTILGLLLTQTAEATGFTLAGGTTSKTLTVTADATISGTPMKDIIDDTTPQLGGNLDLNTKSIDIAAAPSADTWEGEVVTLTAHENVTLGQVCFINASGEAALTDADAVASMPARYMALATISAGAAGLFLRSGIIHLHTPAPSWTIGGLVYCGSGATTLHTAGAMNQGVPTGSGDQVQIVGVALAADILDFNPSPVIVEVA